MKLLSIVIMALSASAASASVLKPVVLPAHQKKAGVQYMRHITFEKPNNTLNQRVARPLQDAAGFACGHSVCTTGAALSSSCSSCAAAVIAADSYCGSTSWDSICVSEVPTYCGTSCTATTSTSKTSTTAKTTTTPSTTTPSTTKTTSSTTASGTLPAHTTPSGGLTWYGGPIINNVEVTIITWGGSPNYLSNLQKFYNGVTGSAWFNIMRQYWTSSTNTIGSGSYIGTVAVGSSTSGFPSTTSLDDANDIQPFLKTLVQNGVITPNKNSYYPIHFPAGYSISMQGSGSCSAFCAYHGTIDISSLGVGTQYLFYGVIPDQGGSCAGGCGSSSSTVNNLFSVASHELAEMVTDPAVGLATGNAAPLAWYNSANGENGDLCNAQQGTTVGRDGATYTVQKTWSNIDNGCVASSAKSP